MVINKLNSYLTGQSKKFPSDFNKIIKEINFDLNNKDSQIELLWKAYNIGINAHKDQLRKSGKPYFSHCIEVACTLAKWRMDLDTITAGLLHDTIEDTLITKEDISEFFNDDIAMLVEGVSKLSGIKFNSRQEKQAENFMKMFLSVARDLRVIIIKFADRLHNMHTINYLPKIKQRRIAIETRDVFAPLAHRLGMNQLKIELEDLVFKTIDPDKYYDIETRYQTNFTDSYDIHYDMCEFMYSWCFAENEMDCREIYNEAKKYNIYMGEFVKAILKIVNMCNELEKAAVVQENMKLLHTLSLVRDKVLKSVATNQSLYV